MPENNEAYFDAKSISSDLLLLDPNNPRLVLSFKEDPIVPDSAAESRQDKIFALFRSSPTNKKDEDFFGIKELQESMEEFGFQPVGQIVLRPIKGSKKFIVVEGNRRVAAVKQILAAEEDKGESEEKLSKDVLDSLRKLPCLILKTKGVSKKELDRRISVTLGLRHFGSVLEWEPHAKAAHVHQQYRALKDGDFAYDAQLAKEVAKMMSISTMDVKKSLLTYRCVEQLKAAGKFPKDRHFSLVQALITNSYLGTKYITRNNRTFEFEAEAIEKIDQVCEFENRDQQANQKINILRKPQDVKDLKELVAAAEGSKDELGLTAKARDLLNSVEQKLDLEGREREESADPGSYKVLTLEYAIGVFRETCKAKEWKVELKRLLESEPDDSITKTTNNLLKLEKFGKKGPYRSACKLLDIAPFAEED